MATTDWTVNLRVERNRELITGWIDNKFTFTIDLRKFGLTDEQLTQVIQRLDERDKQKIDED